jgi:hypothetical protein
MFERGHGKAPGANVNKWKCFWNNDSGGDDWVFRRKCGKECASQAKRAGEIHRQASFTSLAPFHRRENGTMLTGAVSNRAEEVFQRKE